MNLLKSSTLSLLSLTAVLSLVQPASAAELGDPAAPLKIAEWVKGEAVDIAADSNKIYVVEFWATWCPPCLTSIPHLTAMQKKFKDKGVVIIGVSAEDSDTVKKFTRKMGAQMDYAVAVDDDRKTSDGYMKAYGASGIPHAFIVRQGKVIWHGHPMGGLEETLEEIIAGKYNLATARKRQTAQQQLQAFYEMAMQGAPNETLASMGAKLEAIDKEIGGIEPGETFKAEDVINMVKFQKAVAAYQRALAAGKSGADLAVLGDNIKAVAPKDFVLEDFENDVALRATFITYYRAITGTGDTNMIPSLTKKLEQAKSKNATALNEYAWAILTGESVQTRDFALALKLAKAAMDASDGKTVGILDTYARALFDSGDTAGAVLWQKKAAAAEPDSERRKELEATVLNYEKRAAR